MLRHVVYASLLQFGIETASRKAARLVQQLASSAARARWIWEDISGHRCQSQSAQRHAGRGAERSRWPGGRSQGAGRSRSGKDAAGDDEKEKPHAGAGQVWEAVSLSRQRLSSIAAARSRSGVMGRKIAGRPNEAWRWRGARSNSRGANRHPAAHGDLAPRHCGHRSLGMGGPLRLTARGLLQVALSALGAAIGRLRFGPGKVYQCGHGWVEDAEAVA